ncbi:MAG: tetratricopeptide repeat protein [Woeseiaceae bacterium]
MSLIAELKRRNVFRVGVAYIVLAWLLLQVGDTLAPALHLPDWINSALAFFLILGFPLAIFFAWAFELTPEGLKLENNVDRDTSITPQTGRKLDRAIIALLVVGLGYFVWHSQTVHDDDEVVATVAGQPSIAVLPFENMSSDEEQEYFSDGLTEELLNLLAKIPELKVTSRTSAFFFKDKDVKLADVGRELDVDHILEGSVRKSGNTIRITAQLIEVATDAHLWSETWDRALDDVFSIQDEIAAKVVDELRVQLLGELPHAPTTNGEAYTLFLQARHTINQRTHESLMRGEELVNTAIEIDPDYAPAWVLKANIHSQQGDVGARLPREAAPLARAAVERALELDPDNAAAHALSGDIMVSFENNYEGARAAFEKALELDPNDVDVLYQASVYYAFTGRANLALEAGLRAYERDPLFTPIHSLVAYAYGMQGRYEEGEAMIRKRIEVSPDSFGTYYYLAIQLLGQGRLEEALEAAQQERLDGFKQTMLAIVHWELGDREASDAAMQALLAQQSDGWDWQIVEARAVRGEIDQAFEAMEAAYRNRDTGLQLILGDRFVANLRGDPRYDEMVERLGLRVD